VVSLEKAPDGLDIENKGQHADGHAYRRPDQGESAEAQDAPHQRQARQDDVAEEAPCRRQCDRGAENIVDILVATRLLETEHPSSEPVCSAPPWRPVYLRQAGAQRFADNFEVDDGVGGAVHTQYVTVR